MTRENRCHLVTGENVQQERVQPPSRCRMLDVRCGSGDSDKYKKTCQPNSLLAASC